MSQPSRTDDGLLQGHGAKVVAGFSLAVAVLVTGVVLHTAYGDSLVGVIPIYRGAHAWGSDDAFITFRYARNLADGHGLVFNPGEPVEGYTSFLHTVLLASLYGAVGDAGIYLLSVTLNTLFGVAALGVFWLVVRARLDARQASLAALLLAAQPSMWIWSAAGLETTMVLLLQLGLWLGVERALKGDRRGTLPLLGGGAVLLTLARADGFVFVGITCGYLVLRRALRPALVCGGLCAMTFAAHVLWRLGYYGFPLPNTYYAKVAGTPIGRALEGFKRLLWMGFHHFPSLVAFLGVFAAVWFQVVRRAMPRLPNWQAVVDRIPFHLVLVPLLMFYWVYVGGDYFGDRFLLIVYAAGIMTVLSLVDGRDLKTQRLAVAGTLAVQLCAVVWSPMFTYRADKYDYWLELAPYLAARHDDPLLAIDAAGKLPFVTGWRTIDMLGLNDVHIAHKPIAKFVTPGHDKHDADYVLSKQPDLIATWLDPNLDMNYGLDRAKYTGAGYELKYLLNAALSPPDPHVIELSEVDPERVKALYEHGYVYGVLTRISEP